MSNGQTSGTFTNAASAVVRHAAIADTTERGTPSNYPARGFSAQSSSSAISTGNDVDASGLRATGMASIPDSDDDTGERIELASSCVRDVRRDIRHGGSFSSIKQRRRSFSHLSDYHIRGGGKEPAVNGRGIMTSASFMKLVVLAFAAYYLWDTWKPITGDGVPCANQTTAGSLVPCLAFCIIAKLYATRYFLNHSWLSYIISIEPAHQVHTFFGAAVVVLAVAHVSTHTARIIYTKILPHIWDTSRDRAGIVAFVALIATTIPMMWGHLKRKFAFEVRKAVHMLSVVFIVAMCFHTPYMAYLCGVLFTWYVLDRLYFTTRMTFKIEHPTFTPVGRGTFISFDLPDGYDFKVGSYVQVNCPAISTTEWHPFSIFPVPGPTMQGGVHVEAVGDWTKELFRLSLERPRMPLWITAAQASIMEESIYFDNLLLVCTGTGITPAICVAEMYEEKKNIHLVWMSRDASMIAMFEEQLRHVKSTVHLTGKSSDETRNSLTSLLAPIRDGHGVAHFGRSVSRATPTPSRIVDLAKLEAGNAADEDDDVGQDCMRRQTSPGLTVSGVSPANFVQGTSKHAGVRRGQVDGKADTKQSVGTFPVCVEFGRPDIKQYIKATIDGTESSDPRATETKHGRTQRARFFHAAKDHARLNPAQHATKKDLTSADLSAADLDKRRLAKSSAVGPRGLSQATATSNKTQKWLVLYCGGNTFIEKAVAEACEELRVPWKKEYFSAW